MNARPAPARRPLAASTDPARCLGGANRSRPVRRARARRGTPLRAALALTVLWWAVCAGALEFARDELFIETSSGARHRFQIELALTPEQQQRGLMYRESLAADQGMLFDYRREMPVSMWMANTLVPLDMLFIGQDGRIRRIAADTVPLSREVIHSGVPVRAVLELPAGTAARLGIGEGDRVHHAAFQAEGGGPAPDSGR